MHACTCNDCGAQFEIDEDQYNQLIEDSNDESTGCWGFIECPVCQSDDTTVEH